MNNGTARARLSALFMICALLSGCAQRASSARYQHEFIGECPPPGVEIPAPWVFTTEVDRKDVFYGGLPHFTAPLSAFGVEIRDPPSPDHLTIFVALQSCDVSDAPDGEDSVTPCGRYEVRVRGRRIADEAGVQLSEDFPKIFSLDQGYSGFCDSPIREQRGNVCTVWVPTSEYDRGLRITISAQAYDDIPTLVDRARVFLAPDFETCALKIRRVP